MLIISSFAIAQGDKDLVQFTGVEAAYPYSAFEANDFGNGNLKRIINNFSPQRSGDVIVILNPGWVEKASD